MSQHAPWRLLKTLETVVMQGCFIDSFTHLQNDGVFYRSVRGVRSGDPGLGDGDAGTTLQDLREMQYTTFGPCSMAVLEGCQQTGQDRDTICRYSSTGDPGFPRGLQYADPPLQFVNNLWWPYASGRVEVVGCSGREIGVDFRATDH